MYVFVWCQYYIIQPNINKVKKSSSCHAKYDYLHTEKYLTTIVFAFI